MQGMVDWPRGDTFGLPLPIDPDDLRSAGAEWLTRAFRAAGAIGEDGCVERIAAMSEYEGGSTGRKLQLAVSWSGNSSDIPDSLFVKFSRHLSDPIRDRAKIQMASEVRMALMSRLPQFPLAVPRCLFADYHGESGTGILITEEVAFGQNGIEAHREKCLDADHGDLFEHYRALMHANAQLAAAHRSGALPRDWIAPFEDGKGSLAVSDRQPYSADQLIRRIDRLRQFAASYPGLLPPELCEQAFLDRFAAEALGFCGHEQAIAQYLHESEQYNSLSHWNANIDNAWFWRDEEGVLQCGLLDWGNARMMPMGVALAGSLMGSEPEFLVGRLDELLAEYAHVFESSGGGHLDTEVLRRQMLLQLTSSGLLWLIDAPAMIERNFPELQSVESRFDPRFRGNELVRNQLHMLTVFLTVWRNFDIAGLLGSIVAERSKAS